MTEERKIIDEANYQAGNMQPMPSNNAPILGKGGDSLFMNIRASSVQLQELLEETTTLQDLIQRDSCNKVALTCLNNENLKNIYFEIKDGFGDIGPMILMGFKTPLGVEIPRLKLLDKNGNVLEILSGPAAIEEISRRAIIYQNTNLNNYSDVITDNVSSEVTLEKNIE